MHNISTSKGNQTMKFGQLVEENKRNLIPEKSYANVVEKLAPNPFLEN